MGKAEMIMGERYALSENVRDSTHLAALLTRRDPTSRTRRLVALFSHNTTFGSISDRRYSTWRREVRGRGRCGRIAMHGLLVGMRG